MDQVEVSRRVAGAGAAVLVASAVLSSRPALAFLGFGENKDEIYEQETVRINECDLGQICGIFIGASLDLFI